MVHGIDQGEGEWAIRGKFTIPQWSQEKMLHIRATLATVRIPVWADSR